MVIVDHKRVPMREPGMPVRMGVRFRPFPALMLMLMVRVVNVAVFVAKFLVDMLDLNRIAGRPQACG